jgi:hypothetical protein
MRRLRLCLSLAVLLLVALTSAASAAVHIRVAVRPDTIPQCGHGQFFFGIANGGDHTILARVSLALVSRDTVILGPFFGRVRLAAGERRHREFFFGIPSTVPPGNYAWVARAFASDSTQDRSAAPFVVVPGPCMSPEGDLEKSMIEGMGLEPEGATPTQKDSWGSVKKRYH